MAQHLGTVRVLAGAFELECLERVPRTEEAGGRWPVNIVGLLEL